MTLPKATQHTFNGEMRVLVNRRIHPKMDAETLQEHVQTILEGGTVAGIEVQIFEVRGDDVTDALDKGEYDFATGFITSATPISKVARHKKSKAKP